MRTFCKGFSLAVPFLLSSFLIILSFTKINWFFFSRFSAAFFRHILNDVCSRECVSEFVEKSFLLRLLCLCVFYVFYVRLFSSFLSTRTKWLLSSLGDRRLICHTVGNIIATSLPNGMHSLTPRLSHTVTEALSHTHRGALISGRQLTALTNQREMNEWPTRMSGNAQKTHKKRVENAESNNNGRFFFWSCLDPFQSERITCRQLQQWSKTRAKAKKKMKINKI